MAKFKHLGVISGALLLSALLAGCAFQRGLGNVENPEDADITAKVQALLSQHPDLGPPNAIYATTYDHEVYLSGLAATPLQSESAEALAHEIPDVAAVVSTIAVEQ